MATDDDFQLQSYQDDLTTDDNASDPLMDKTGEDPAKIFGIPSRRFKEELDKEEADDFDDNEYPEDVDIRDDQRAYIESLDEDDENA